MKRAIAGILDYGRPFHEGPLTIVGADLDGGGVEPDRPFCMLDGYLDNATALASDLGLPESSEPELVLGTAYRRWGDAALERLRGDFSILIWDRRERRGVMACDQFGARSIFLHSVGRRLYFASDLQPLLGLLPTQPGPDHAGVAEYLAIHSLTRACTMYEGVRQLPPAHAIRLEDPAWTSFRYWAPSYRGVIQASPDELVEEIRRTMSAAVKRRLSSHGLTAVTMSGGMDSTTVAALAQELAPGNLRSYSTTMPDFPDEDESFWIERMKEFTGISVRTFPTRPRGIVAAGLRNLRARALPAVSTTDFIREPLMAAAASDGATILLGGDGGDEVFGTRDELIADRVRQGRLVSAVALGNRHPDAGPSPVWHLTLRAALKFGFEKNRPYLLDDLETRIRGADRYGPAWLLPDSARRLFDAREDTSWKRTHGPRWWAAFADIVTRNHARVGLFDEVRRAANQHGLDPRHPLLDFELVELALQLPPELSFNPSLNRPMMRRAMEGVLPQEVLRRPNKTNFVPLTLHALLDDMPIVTRVLDAPDAEIYRYADRDTVRRLVDGTLHGGRLNQGWLDSVWRLFMAQCWLRTQSDPGFATSLLDLSDFPANGHKGPGANDSRPTFFDLAASPPRPYTPPNKASTGMVEHGISGRR